MKTYRKFCLLTFVSMFLISATFGAGFIIQVTCKQATSSYLADPFPQAGKFYTLAGRSYTWEIIGEDNVTTEYIEEMNKWSVQDVVGNVALVNRTYVEAYKRPQTGGKYTDTYDFDYEIYTNRTILSANWKVMSFTTTGFLGLDQGPLNEDIGEHTWAWFPTGLYIGVIVNVSWTFDRNFVDDMLYEVVGVEVIEVIGERQECWILSMPPSLRIDGTQWRAETYWVDKDSGVPLKFYCKGWAVDGSFGWEDEEVLVHTNIDLGPESTEHPSPTYTLAVPSTLGYPETGKFYAWYYLAEGWFMSGMTNITYYEEGIFTWLIAEVTDNVALVHRILWVEHVRAEDGIEELENVAIYYYNYTMNTNTRKILSAAGTRYRINMTSLTYETEDRTSLLVGDVGEETYAWFPTNLNIGATVNITWTHDIPTNVDNATYTVIGENIIPALGRPQECWMLNIPPTPSIDGTWNYTEIWYSDKDVGAPLALVGEGWRVDGTEAYVDALSLIDLNFDLGPQTYVFPITTDSQTFYVVVVTNSTVPIDTFIFSQEDMEISFNVTESSETKGFCNVTIPEALLTGSPWTVKINNATITPTIASNDTHTFLYFNYTHSTSLIEIVGTWVIPEFPATMILPLLITATLVALIARKKRKSNIISR